MAAKSANVSGSLRAAEILSREVATPTHADVRVLLLRLHSVTVPAEMAQGGVRVQSLLGSRAPEFGAASWTLAAEVGSAPVAGDHANEVKAGRGAVARLAAAVAFPWYASLESPSLRLRLTEPPLRSAAADVLVEVPPLCRGAEPLCRELPVPIKDAGGRWFLGSLVIDMEVRHVRRTHAVELFGSSVDAAECPAGPCILPEATMPVVPLAQLPCDGATRDCFSETTCSTPELEGQPGSPVSSAGNSLALPLLIRRRPGVEVEALKV